MNNKRYVKLFDNSELVLIQNNDIHQTKAVEVYFQCSEESPRNNAIAELFCQIIYEPTFTALRTQEQLGEFFSKNFFFKELSKLL